MYDVTVRRVRSLSVLDTRIRRTLFRRNRKIAKSDY